MKIKSKIFPVIAYVLIYFVLMSMMFANGSIAATFTVNSGFDVNDLEPGNGLCVAYLVIVIPAVLTFCTLRAAIEETNALPGEDVILLGAGSYRLSIAGINDDQAATGDLDITDSLRIIGAGADKTFIDAAGLDRVLDVSGQNSTVFLSGVTIINGQLPAGLSSGQKGGGGIRNVSSLSLNESVLSNNNVSGVTSDDVGGGLFNKGICSVKNSTIHTNTANEGGGIFNDSHSTLTVSSSTVNNNFSQGGGGLTNYGSGNLTNTTLSNNTASGTSALPGGAIQNWGQLQITQCTIAENSSSGGGGGVSNNGAVSMVNTLISANVGGNCHLAAEIVSQGHNLDSDNTCTLTDLQTDLRNIDPRLGSLQNNGGPTRTHALNPGSPAIDGAKYLLEIAVDQRGVPRPQRKSFDIGAFEAFNISIAPFVAPLLLRVP
jgi:hypothetical protein